MMGGSLAGSEIHSRESCIGRSGFRCLTGVRRDAGVCTDGRSSSISGSTRELRPDGVPLSWPPRLTARSSEAFRSAVLRCLVRKSLPWSV